MAKNTNSREAIDKAAALFEKGEGIGEVMRITGVTKYMARKLRSACGYTPVGERIRKAVAQYPDANPTKISQIADCTYSSAHRVMRGLGL